MSRPIVRPLTGTDAAAARRLVQSVYGGTRYLSRTLELVAMALGGNDPECLGFVVGASVHGLLLCGAVAGALGVIKVHTLISSAPDILASMVSVLRDVRPFAEARLVVCELPDDVAHVTAAAALAANGFTREGSVPGFVAEGTALGLYVWRRGELGG